MLHIRGLKWNADFAKENVLKMADKEPAFSGTNETLSKILDELSNAKCIYTDRLRQYSMLIDPKIHKITKYGTNHIERRNLTIRTHIKYLTRKTICFSRKVAMLAAVLAIYFWG